jgi:hypothetical protein
MKRKTATATMIPFPSVKRSGFALRHAKLAAELRPHKAEEHIERQIRMQREVMGKKGIAAKLIDSDLSALRNAMYIHYRRITANECA